jgi:hypothetical protein
MPGLILTFFELVLFAAVLVVVFAFRSRVRARQRPADGRAIFQWTPGWLLVVLWFVLMFMLGLVIAAKKSMGLGE